ncbi:MAG: radical SAM family heme chaperone HemW [Cyclobacteriaceae bacterium]|nr:radical SAM family heme chaperone HemW [Cyclobacteriaceae bacterium]
MAGIYIHIPFCRKACYYCDFHFSTGMKTIPLMVKAIQKELELTKEHFKYPIDTLYFGGGTPSTLTISDLEKILEVLYKNYAISDMAEITMEANPDDLTKDYLYALKKIGINRLSIGIQSFEDSVLLEINRCHTSKQALSSFENARNAGFDNISIDLIYGLPKTSIHSLEHDLETILKIQPDHVSVYGLTIEDKTVFGHQHKKGLLKILSEEEESERFELIMDFLENNGHIQYEISNFGKPGKESKHNSSYWEGKPYLGIGPSSHSFEKNERWKNVSNNTQYIKSINQGILPREHEIRDKNDLFNEYILTTLRTIKGCNTQLIMDKWGIIIDLQSNPILARYEQEGYLWIENKIIHLTRKGKLMADQIASDLFIIE